MMIRRGNKFGAKKVEYKGIKFDSKAECIYYQQLEIQRANFKYHESFELRPHFKLGKRTIRHEIYTPDFTLYNDKNELIKIVDVKGGNATLTTSSRSKMRNLEYQLKMPVTLARYDYRSGIFIEKEF